MSFIDCHSCNIPFDVGTYRPRLLACGDTICEACVKESLNQNTFLSCPGCKHTSEVKNIKNVPLNYTLLDILALPRQKQQLTIESSRIRNNLIHLTDKQEKYLKAITYYSHQISELTEAKNKLLRFKEQQLKLVKESYINKNDNKIKNNVELCNKYEFSEQIIHDCNIVDQMERLNVRHNNGHDKLQINNNKEIDRPGATNISSNLPKNLTNLVNGVVMTSNDINDSVTKENTNTDSIKLSRTTYNNNDKHLNNAEVNEESELLDKVDVCFKDYTSIVACEKHDNEIRHSKITFRGNLVELNRITGTKCDKNTSCTLQLSAMERFIRSRKHMVFFDISAEGSVLGRVYIQVLDCSLSQLLIDICIGQLSISPGSIMKNNLQVCTNDSKEDLTEKLLDIIGEVDLNTLFGERVEGDEDKIENQEVEGKEVQTEIDEREAGLIKLLEDSYADNNNANAIMLRPRISNSIYKYSLKNLKGRSSVISKRMVSFNSVGDLIIYLKCDADYYSSNVVGWVVDGFENLLSLAQTKNLDKYKLTNCGIACEL